MTNHLGALATACLLFTVAFGGSPAFGQSPSASACQKTVAKETAAYVRAVTQAVDKCLGKLSAEVVQKGASTTAAASAQAAYCAAAFTRLASTGAPQEAGARFASKVTSKCDPTADALLGAGNVGEWCETLGGDGTIDDFGEWLGCLRAGADAEAHATIATRWPRALEYFAALAPALGALPPSGPTDAAHTALVALDAAIEGPVDDDEPDPTTVTNALLRTGQTLCDPGPLGVLIGPCDSAPKDQDGFAQAGLDVSYTDNGDGTITDHVTGLTWEKLGNDGSVHDQLGTFTYTEAVTVKLAALNTGAGFAGHTDWRLPNRRELESIVDAGRFDPAIRTQFDDACIVACSSDACSCTLPEAYWTSTAYQADPSKRWVVDFHQGFLLPSGSDTPAHVRVVRGGVNVAASGSLVAAATAGKASASLAKCQKTVAKESAKYAVALTGTVAKCLDRLSAEVVGKGATVAAAAQTAGASCIAAFRKIVSSGSPDRTLAGLFDAKVAAKCDPAVSPGLSHADADTWTIGERTLAAAHLGAYCAQHGGGGSIDEFPAWQRCVRTVVDTEARQAIALRWPRALEYFAALASTLAALPPSSATSDALAALTALDVALEGATDDDRPEPPPPPPPGLLATGQTQCVQNDLTMGPCPGGLPGQDGDVGAGIERRYTDNGDGTITDQVTGLMWEKLADDDSIHDRDHDYAQAGAHLNKIPRLNRHGFAGYSDWRVPNRRELESLVDAGRTAPAIDPTFAHDCTPGCSVLQCSCTALSGYLSSTVRSQGGGFKVDFTDGAVGASGNRVRAVRAGNTPVRTHVNEPPVAIDIDLKHPWKTDCVPINFIGDFGDSPTIHLEFVTFPTNGFIDWMPSVVPMTPTPPGNGQIAAAVPDNYWWWGPYESSSDIMTNYLPDPAHPTWIGSVFCYVSFSTTFTGTDSLTYRVRDSEGSVSNVASATITIFEP